ncbi:MAG: hypothetical protein P4L11_07170 [Geothrix sp.]|nr:hypothetical protein [Geothrix sp.]
MIRHLLLALALVLPLHPAQAQFTFQCGISAPQPWLGQAILWHLSSTGAGSGLPIIAPDQLAPDWYIYDQNASASTDNTGHAAASSDITLYPMRTGELTLPSVHAGGASCPAMAVNIAGHAPGQPAMIVTAHLDPPHPYVGQRTHITFDISYAGDLTWDSVIAQSPNTLLTPLDIPYPQQTQLGPTTNLRQFAWTILPLSAGIARVQFSRLSARRDGPIEIFPAPQDLQIPVRAVPAFWPTGGLIGAPSATLLAASPQLNIGQTGLLRLELSDTGLTRERVAHLFVTQATAPGLQFDPPLIRRMPTDYESLEDVWQIDLPFKAMQPGDFQYPKFRLPYFDPQSGAPRAVFLQPGILHVADPLRVILHKIIAVAAALFLAALAAFYLRRRMLTARARARLRGAQTVAQLRDLWLAWPPVAAAARAKPTTLRQWLTQHGATHAHDAALMDLAAKIERQLYGPAPDGELAAPQAEQVAALITRRQKRQS